jgi:hypothetical protein
MVSRDRLFRHAGCDVADGAEPIDLGRPVIAEAELPPCPSPLRHPLRAAGWLVTLAAGIASLVAVLSVLAAIPLANIVALGAMLEAEGRVVRSGRLRDALPFAGLLPRLGGIALGTAFWIGVVLLVAEAASDAALVAPGSAAAVAWARARTLAAVIVSVHIVLAIHAGGGFAAFFRPLRNLRLAIAAAREGTAWSASAAAIERGLDAVRPLGLFWLGLRGFAGALLWLVVPTNLFSALRHTRRPGEVIAMLAGALGLVVVLSWVPFLQARFAATGRLAEFRDWRGVRELYRRAPVAMLVAVIVLYGLSLPLYLFKVLVPPRDALPLITPVFVVTILPARVLVGWATARAQKAEKRAWLLVRVAASAALVALLAVYLAVLFFMPAIGAFGRRVLFEHHALLLPTPF